MTPRAPAQLLRDVRALGSTAPVRAVYEASKAMGGHRLLFGSLDRPAPSLPTAVLPAPDAGSAAHQRARDEARRIVAGSVPLFSRQTPFDGAAWHVAPDTGAIWDRDLWWKVDIRSSHRPADVKWTWELGRHRHLLVLARACDVGHDSAAFHEALEAQLSSWISQNPPEHGVHWYSNLEIALRALVWLQILQITGDALHEELRAAMADHLFHSGRHLMADLPYTVSSMRNNHMLGDALGLMALGKGFAQARWWRLGDRLFRGQLERHMRSDGSMIEDSLSYHRFVVEMLAVRVLLGSASDATRRALQLSGEHLARLGVFEGAVPQYGDWDEGRVLGSSGDPLDVAGAAALALSLSGTGAPPRWRDRYDECAWYVSEGEPAAVPASPSDGRSAGGGFSRVQVGDWVAWLKAGGGTSHQHADLCSTVVRVGAQWVVGDPGTGTYNGPLSQRNAFRTSGAHSVLRLDGEDQLLPHRAFRWLRTAVGAVGPAAQVPGAAVMWGVHDAYRRSGGSGLVARLVVLTSGVLTTCDLVEDGQGRRWDLTLPLHPAVAAEGDELRLPDGQSLRLDAPAEPTRVHGAQEPYAGWWSDTYGSAVPATWLQMAGTVDGPVVWSIHERGRVPARRLPDGVEVAGTSLRLAFTSTGASLTVSGQGRTSQVLWARLPK